MSKSAGVSAHPVTQLLRVTWLVLPFVAAGTLTDALDPRSAAVRVVATVLAWALWAVVMVATLVRLPVALTVVRIWAPAAPVAVVAAALVAEDPGILAAVAAAIAALAAVLACSGWVADDMVDGASYGDERRFSLRAPASLLVGPLPLAVLVCWSVVVGPLLLASEQWVIGAALTIVSIGLAALATRSVHSLSARSLVFVPAGVTLVDPLSLVDSVLLGRSRLASLGPALTGTDALDLSGGALGLALEARSTSPIEITRRSGRREGDAGSAVGLVFTPARPAAVLAEAAQRGLPVDSHRATPPPTTSSPR